MFVSNILFIYVPLCPLEISKEKIAADFMSNRVLSNAASGNGMTREGVQGRVSAGFGGKEQLVSRLSRLQSYTVNPYPSSGSRHGSGQARRDRYFSDSSFAAEGR
jgi:hypothetical protein